MGKVHLLIPARYGSTRFPGKPLFHLVGAKGHSKSLLRRSIEAARAGGFGEPVVLTDDVRIVEEAHKVGVAGHLTPASARNGSERCALYAAEFDLDPDDIVVNFQGDACLTPPEWVGCLVHSLRQDNFFAASTMVGPWTLDPSAVTAVFDSQRRALYFSRSTIPHGPGARWQHFGIYAYRVRELKQVFLSRYRPEPGPLESSESLEQLRLLESGYTLRCIESPSGVRLPRCEVNTPEDVAHVERELSRWGIE